MNKPVTLHIIHSSHLDLYWIGEQSVCLEKGAKIIEDAVERALKDHDFHFFIESVRFLEYYLSRYPHRTEDIKCLVDLGNIEIAACYSDREENPHDGEALVRNPVYGKRILWRLLKRDTHVAHHPDLPGLSEQTPQIFKKCGVDYYLFARGFRLGKRFRWRSPDCSEIIACNFPIHYSYYNVAEDVIPNLEEIRKLFHSEDDVLISCSAGDLGPLNTFVSCEGNKHVRRDLTELIQQWRRDYPQIKFRLDNAQRVLSAMSETGLESLGGESPSKWGLRTACQIPLFRMDRLATDALCMAETAYSLCRMRGLKVACSYVRNPIAHAGSSGGERRYFDLAYNPKTVEEWLEYAWRLLLVTEDHNFGGIEGAQSFFDRFIYLRTALEIGEKIRKASVEALASTYSGEILAFNPLNWQRAALLKLPGEAAAGDVCCFEDALGRAYPAVYTQEGWQAYVENIPSLGVMGLKKSGSPACFAQTHGLYGDEYRVTVRNPWYEITLLRGTGVIESWKDLFTGEELITDDRFLSIDLYEDESNSVNEHETNPRLLDSSRGHVHGVYVEDDNPLYTTLRVETQVFDAVATLRLKVMHCTREVRITPEINWHGALHVQVRLHLGMGTKEDSVFYAAPYAVAKLGESMAELKTFASDEICDALYARYREVRGWFARQGSHGGVGVATNIGNFDFDGPRTDAVLIKNVYSCGDLDYVPTNEGRHTWEAVLTTYEGDWAKAGVWRENWQLRREIQVLKGKGKKPCAGTTFIMGLEAGVLMTIKPADLVPDAYALRLASSLPQTQPFTVSLPEEFKVAGEADLMENLVSQEVNPLGAWEIKTLLIEKGAKTEASQA